jgi:hypothetical protein
MSTISVCLPILEERCFIDFRSNNQTEQGTKERDWKGGNKKREGLRSEGWRGFDLAYPKKKHLDSTKPPVVALLTYSMQ